MDDVDLRLLRAMGYMPFQFGPRHPDALKASSLAKIVGTTAETVRNRLQRMEKAGILLGYQVYPNEHHLGLKQTTYHFRVEPSRKPELFKTLEPVDGISGVFDYVGPDICVDVFYRTEAERARRVELLKTLSSSPPLRLYECPTPPVPRALTALDWRILKAMRGKARAPLPEIAKAVGVSARTVKRRVDTMAAEGAFDVVPMVDPSRIPNFIPIALACHFDAGRPSPEVVARIRKALDDRLWHAWSPPASELGNLDILAYANSTAEVSAIRDRVTAVEGVARVEVLLPAGGRLNMHWMDEAIEARIQALSKNTNGPS